jgi:hypothetical protein
MAVRELMQKALKDDLVSEQFCTDIAQSARLGCRRRLLQVRRTDIPHVGGPLHDAKRQHAPFICSMAQRDNHQTDASHDAAAIARWDDEGGAAASVADKTVRKYQRIDPSERRVEVPTSLKVDRTLVEG